MGEYTRTILKVTVYKEKCSVKNIRKKPNKDMVDSLIKKEGDTKCHKTQKRKPHHKEK